MKKKKKKKKKKQKKRKSTFPVSSAESGISICFDSYWHGGREYLITYNETYLPYTCFQLLFPTFRSNQVVRWFCTQDEGLLFLIFLWCVRYVFVWFLKMPYKVIVKSIWKENVLCTLLSALYQLFTVIRPGLRTDARHFVTAVEDVK